MGVSASSPEPSLECFRDDEQRTILRNFQLLACRDPSTPGKFSQLDFLEGHAGMPRELGVALFRMLSAATSSTATASFDSTVFALATFRSEMPPRSAKPMRVAVILFPLNGWMGERIPLCVTRRAALRLVYVATMPLGASASSGAFVEESRRILSAASKFLTEITAGTCLCRARLNNLHIPLACRA